MIQRIQTVYLLIIAILTAIMHFIPLATIHTEGESVKLMSYGVVISESVMGLIVRFPYMIILASLSCILAIVIIFLYKKRIVQIRLCFAEIVLLIGAQIMVVLYISRYSDFGTITYGIASIFPIICAIFGYLALRGVMKDEAKVRSLDRIR